MPPTTNGFNAQDSDEEREEFLKKGRGGLNKVQTHLTASLADEAGEGTWQIGTFIADHPSDDGSGYWTVLGDSIMSVAYLDVREWNAHT